LPHSGATALLEADKPVRLGSRALDVLIALVEHAGELVGKNELMARVWPDTIVEEGTSRSMWPDCVECCETAALATATSSIFLGEVYRFVAPVTHVDDLQPSAPPAAATKREHNLPTLLTRLIGRVDNINELTELLPQRRMITIAGPGGIGKTAVAVRCRRGTDRRLRAWRLADRSGVGQRPAPRAKRGCCALGLEIHSEGTFPSLIAALRHKRMLLVLDNCEHVIAAAAKLAAGILSSATRVHIIARVASPCALRASTYTGCARATQDSGSQFGCCRDHVLAVVEHKQHPLVPKRGNQAGKRSFGMNLEPECGSNRAWHEERVADRRQIDQPDAMLVDADLFLGDSDGDGRLSYPARSSDGGSYGAAAAAP